MRAKSSTCIAHFLIAHGLAPFTKSFVTIDFIQYRSGSHHARDVLCAASMVSGNCCMTSRPGCNTRSGRRALAQARWTTSCSMPLVLVVRRHVMKRDHVTGWSRNNWS